MKETKPANRLVFGIEDGFNEEKVTFDEEVPSHSPRGFYYGVGYRRGNNFRGNARGRYFNKRPRSGESVNTDQDAQKSFRADPLN